MLIEFSVGNYASFKEQVTLSLVAAKIRSRIKMLDQENIISVNDDLGLLASVAVYGPNASGKSNLVAAAAFMQNFVIGSFKDTQFNARISAEPFRLSSETENRPSFFEMVFLSGGHQYRYGFEANTKQVAAEWLYYVPKLKEVKLFERQGQDLFPNLSNPQAKEFRAIKALLPKINPEQPLRPNALFLSVAAQNNGPVAQEIVTWFSNMRFMSGLSDDEFRHFTIEMFKDPSNRARILELVRSLDVNIQDIEMQLLERAKVLGSAPEPIRDILNRLNTGEFVRIITTHEKFNAQGEVDGHVKMDMGRQESEGTEKLFFMAGPIIDTLTNGRVLWVDEMEARLHPNMTDAIIALFNSKMTNPKGAQLIFTTHDTNLLSVKKLRRDQIWFIDKDRFESSRLYSLVEFKIRNDDASLEEDYIRGRYGAVPHLGELRGIYEAKSQ